MESISHSENTEEVDQTERTIPFQGSLTVSDVYAAGTLAQSLGNWIAMWVIRGFFVIAFIFMSWLTVYTHWKGDPNFARMAFTGALGVLLLICFGIGREIWYRKLANQLCKEGKLLYAPTEGEIDSDSIRSKSADGEGILKWSGFCGYRESDTVLILYFRCPNSYVIMARSKFVADQDWIDFCQLVSKKLNRI